MINVENLKQISKLVSENYNYATVLQKLNLSTSSGNYKVLKRFINENKLSVDHFLNRKETALKLFKDGKLNKTPVEEAFAKDSTYARYALKRRIIQEDLIVYECSFCKNKGEWMGNKISLILDHINGVRNDNRLINLRFVCPNCNAALPTHCRGQKGLEVKRDKRKDYLERVKKEYEDSQVDSINRVINSNIDFSKLGWVEKTSKIINLPSQKTGKWVKRFLPNIYEKAYIRKSPKRN